jgi:hypothetical protein
MTATHRAADHRSRNARRPMTALLVALLTASLAGLMTIAPAQAEPAGLAGEATRQLQFARVELEAGQFDRARKSAASALRLDPGLYEAMMVQGLALEGAGETILAEALLRTSLDLIGPGQASSEARAALARLTGTELAPTTQDGGTAPHLARIASSERG